MLIAAHPAVEYAVCRHRDYMVCTGGGAAAKVSQRATGSKCAGRFPKR